MLSVSGKLVILKGTAGHAGKVVLEDKERQLPIGPINEPHTADQSFVLRFLNPVSTPSERTMFVDTCARNHKGAEHYGPIAIVVPSGVQVVNPKLMKLFRTASPGWWVISMETFQPYVVIQYWRTLYVVNNKRQTATAKTLEEYDWWMAGISEEEKQGLPIPHWRFNSGSYEFDQKFEQLSLFRP